MRAREQDEKINILIHFQMETTEKLNRTSELVDKTTEQMNKLSADFRADLAAGHAIHEKEMAEIRREQQLTHRELQALIRTLRKGRNGNSSD